MRLNDLYYKAFFDILTEAQYIEMYKRMKLKQNETYNKYIENIRDDIDFKNKRKELSNRQYRKRMDADNQAEHNN